MNILVFDSGIGGRSVYNLLDQELSKDQHHLAYFADTAHYPYGTKSQTELSEIITKNIQEFNKDGMDMIVVACNTASAIIDQILRTKDPAQYQNVVTIISPTIETVKQVAPISLRIIASEYTITHHVYSEPIKAIFPQMHIQESAQQELINHIESNLEHEVETEVKRIIEAAEDGEALLLGCTHFSLVRNVFEDEIKKCGKNITLIDPAKHLFEKVIEVIV